MKLHFCLNDEAPENHNISDVSWKCGFQNDRNESVCFKICFSLQTKVISQNNVLVPQKYNRDQRYQRDLVCANDFRAI